MIAERTRDLQLAVDFQSAHRIDLMLVLTLVGAFALSLASALALIPVVRSIAHTMGWMDRPDGHRKVHVREIPRVGGLAVIAAMGVAFAGFALMGGMLSPELVNSFQVPTGMVVLGALLMAAVGFIDDVRDMHALPKLIAQALISLLVVGGGVRISILDGALGGGELALGVSILLTVVWTVGIVNGVNFIDGMDGLAGGVVAIGLVGLGTVHAIGGDLSGLVIVAVTLGAVIGFLRYNVRPASIFMGDVGSHFLGYVLAVLALRGTAHGDPSIALTIAAVALGLPVLDALVTIIRRPQYDKPLLHSDGDHFHHRLMIRFPNETVLRILYFVSVVFAMGAILMALLPAAGALVVFGVGVCAVAAFLSWMGYLPGRFAQGPADGHASSRSLHRIVVGAMPHGGDGALYPADIALSKRVDADSSKPVKGINGAAAAAEAVGGN